MFRDFNSDSDGTCGAEHFRHTLRTRRCAINARVEEATRNGFTPMSIKRVTAPGASLVWRVEKTRWPVSDALIAIEAVSQSPIFPSMIKLWGLPSNERQAAANGLPTNSLN